MNAGSLFNSSMQGHTHGAARPLCMAIFHAEACTEDLSDDIALVIAYSNSLVST